MFLITGYPRSGTKYTATFLQQAGVDAKHEGIGRDGCVSWLHIRDGHWADKLNIKNVKFDVIVHQIRNPIDVISSSQTIRDFSLGYMYSHMKKKYINRSKLEQIMFTYIVWDDIISKERKWWFRVEDLPYITNQLFDVLGIDKAIISDVSHKVNTDVNTRKNRYKKLTWDDLLRCNKNLTGKVMRIATKYNYL